MMDGNINFYNIILIAKKLLTQWKVLTKSPTPISVRLTIFPNLTKIDQRKNEADRIRERYPDRIPVICEKSKSSKLPDIDKTK